MWEGPDDRVEMKNSNGRRYEDMYSFLSSDPSQTLCV